MKGVAEATLAVLALTATGCNHDEGSLSELAIEKFLFEKQSPSKSELVLGDHKIQVELEPKFSGGQLTINLVSFGQTVESERYRIEDGQFLLSEAAGEQYVPPLPLIKNPFKMGDGWDWVGVLRSGELSSQATAKITSQSETLFLPNAAESLKVDVDLTIRSGPSVNSKRSLTFWFAPGKGVIQRKFGSIMRSPIKP